MTTSRWLMMGLLLGFTMAASCGGEPATPCSPASCATGCCDANGECQAGNAQQHCGTQGNQCQSCDFARSCQLGFCVTAMANTGGGTASDDGGAMSAPICTRFRTATDTFFEGKTACSHVDGGSLSIDEAVAARCNDALPSCGADDTAALEAWATCVGAAAACATGNEALAISTYRQCELTAHTELSTACRLGFSTVDAGTGGGAGTTGGGDGMTGGGTGMTGGGTGTTGGGDGTTGGGDGTTGGGDGTTGGGTGTTGGGTGTTGGGTGTTGGGTGTTGGGTGMTGGGTGMTGGGGGDTCAGCLSGSTCITTPTSAACGSGGAQCVACTSPDSCVSGACGIDPASVWLVRPVLVTVTSPTWDLTSPADLYIELWCPSTEAFVTYTTPTVQDSDTAEWTTGGCTLTAAQLMTVGFDFRVADRDPVGSDTVQARALVRPQEAQLRSGAFTSASPAISIIRFALIKQ